MNRSMPRWPYYPPKIPATVTAGSVVVHNHVRPSLRQGTRGFRFWLQEPNDLVERCDCPWAPELAEHYRVLRLIQGR